MGSEQGWTVRSRRLWRTWCTPKSHRTWW